MTIRQTLILVAAVATAIEVDGDGMKVSIHCLCSEWSVCHEASRQRLSKKIKIKNKQNCHDFSTWCTIIEPLSLFSFHFIILHHLPIIFFSIVDQFFVLYLSHILVRFMLVFFCISNSTTSALYFRPTNTTHLWSSQRQVVHRHCFMFRLRLLFYFLLLSGFFLFYFVFLLLLFVCFLHQSPLFVASLGVATSVSTCVCVTVCSMIVGFGFSGEKWMNEWKKMTQCPLDVIKPGVT